MSVIKGYVSALDTADYRRLDTLQKIQAFDNVVGIVLNTATTEEEWNAVYDEVFGGKIGDAAKAILTETGMAQPDYYDPDTTYREDVLAWAGPMREAMQQYAEGRRKIMAMMD